MGPKPVAPHADICGEGSAGGVLSTMGYARDQHDDEELEALRQFRNDCRSYVRLYDFMSQVVDYGTTDLEKLAEFLRQFARLIDLGDASTEVDVTGLEMRRGRQIDQGNADIGLAGDQGTPRL